MTGVADDVQDAVLKVAVTASRGEATATRAIADRVERMARSLVAVVGEVDFSTLSVRERKSEATRLIDESEAIIDAAYDDIAETSRKSAESLAVIQAVALRDKVGAEMDEDLKLKGGAKAVRDIASDWIVLGADLDGWWDRARAETKHRVSAEIRMASIAGDEAKAVVDRIAGEKQGKERKGGALSFSRNDAKASSKSSHNAITNAAVRRVIADNRGLFRGVIAVATLDARTSKLCLARNGSSWDLKGNPLGRTQGRFPGPPPWHPHCRTILIPLLKGEDDPEVMSAEDWLSRKGDEFARDLLGATAFDLWSKDKITTSDLLDQSGRPLTSAELEDEFS